MKRHTVFSLMFVLLTALFLFGFSQSQQGVLSSNALRSPYWVGEDIPNWDWDSDKLADLGDVAIRDWDSILKEVNAGPGEDEEYRINLRSFESLVRDNIFTFSRLGTCQIWNPSMWDVIVNIDDPNWSGFPTSNVLRSILMDDAQQKTRDAFLAKTVEIFRDPATKKLWDKQRQDFWESMEIASEEDIYPDYRDDFRRMQNTGYEVAMQAALDNLIKHMETTDYTLKVLPASGVWQLIRISGEVFQAVWDESPLKINSACYRMGKAATGKLVTYVKELRRQYALK